MKRKQGHPTDLLLTRRTLGKLCGAFASSLAVWMSGCTSFWKKDAAPAMPPIHCASPEGDPATYEYIVVGSGAGGGPLAANLAKAGHRVLLLEAGSNEESFTYQVPAFHGLASEDDAQKWSFFVRHYESEAQQARDDKYQQQEGGVLYPRAGALGGCTAHHAMITIYPHKSDWDEIATLMGDPSWSDRNMRKYFERLERCQYVDAPSHAEDNPTRHGFSGWLTTNTADPFLVIGDKPLKRILRAAAHESLLRVGNLWTRLKVKLEGHLDPNDWRWRKTNQSPEGLVFTPLSTNEGKRVGVREYVRRVHDACPNNLTITLFALATRVLFEDLPGGGKRAVGVEYLDGQHLYRADPHADPTPQAGVRRTVRASREVIVAGGAFNTPQLLMLSGIGPTAELEKHGIKVEVPLAGVGQNLQDRYEVGVVSEMAEDFSILKGATFKPPDPRGQPDPVFAEWVKGKGVYTTNGAVASLIKRSTPDKPDPDLFIFGVVGLFRGYYPGYSKDAVQNKNFFTWAVLKAHTRNRAGSVTLRSHDPRDTPHVNFRYFDEGSAGHEEDVDAVVEGIETARRIMKEAGDIVKHEVVPGGMIQTREQLKQFVKDNAWGHHASCSCKMGPKSDPMAVVDGNFRVYGTNNLRVVDASIFPRIPGFFIVTSVYMISEKASDVILADAQA